MAKADRGTKRQCLKCGTKYYDLNRDPIVCPNCGAPFALGTAASTAPVEPKEAPVEETGVEEVETDTAAAEAGAEVVSMEEAEKPDSPSKDEAEEDESVPDVDDIEDIGGEVDNSYIEDEDGDDDNIDFDVERDDEER